MKPLQSLQNASKNCPQNPKNSSKTFCKLFSASIFSAIFCTSFVATISATTPDADSLKVDSFIPPPPQIQSLPAHSHRRKSAR
ncbi:hypothetical protein CQA40_10160 [Helicobacter sp. MIT 01-3238]|nr:hypothetical protein CQA40_10160 [Helicobacter sp. MIT 01-3238]